MEKQLIEKFAKGLNNVWDAIGADMLVNENGEMDESVTMKREEVFEVCSDCYFDIYSKLTKDENEAFCYRDRSKDNDLMKKAFPYKLYGW